MQSFLYKDKPDELAKIKEENLNNIMQGCQEKYASQIRRIIKDQLLHRYFHDHSTPSSKRLNDPNYFDKFFIGCTPDNIISDRMSYELVEKMSDTEHNKNAITLDSFLDKYGWEEVKKMVSFIIDLEKDAHEKNAVAKKMAISMSLMQFTGQGVHWWSAEMFLCNIMNNMFLPETNSHHDIKLDEEIIFNTGKTIIESASLDFIPRFASVLYEDLKVERNKKNTLIYNAIYGKVPEDQIKNNAAIKAFLKSYNNT